VQDVDLDGNHPSVAVMRADRLDQAAEREAAGLRWRAGIRQGIHHGHRYTAGARHIRKMF
jgi:hypothetical protein